MGTIVGKVMTKKASEKAVHPGSQVRCVQQPPSKVAAAQGAPEHGARDVPHPDGKLLLPRGGGWQLVESLSRASYRLRAHCVCVYLMNGAMLFVTHAHCPGTVHCDAHHSVLLPIVQLRTAGEIGIGLVLKKPGGVGKQKRLSVIKRDVR